MKTCVQTLFLPRESLPYMEEWLLYHTLLGFDKFRLYDNTGSDGDSSSAYRQINGNLITKYGLATISKDTTDEQLDSTVREICKKFNAEIIKWPSKLYTSQVQMAAVGHHCRVDDSDFTAFIDMDEYICVGDHKHIKEFMSESLVSEGFCGVRMSQRKMPHILKAKSQQKSRVWDLTDTFSMNTKGWAPKSIVATKSVMPAPNIHEIRCKGRMLDQPHQDTIRINHYNTNGYQMMWLSRNHKNFDKDRPFEMLFLGQSQDRHMDAFRKEMEAWDYVNWEDI